MDIKETIQKLAGRGLTDNEVAFAVGLTVDELNNVYGSDLDTGRSMFHKVTALRLARLAAQGDDAAAEILTKLFGPPGSPEHVQQVRDVLMEGEMVLKWGMDLDIKHEADGVVPIDPTVH